MDFRSTHGLLVAACALLAPLALACSGTSGGDSSEQSPSPNMPSSSEETTPAAESRLGDTPTEEAATGTGSKSAEGLPGRVPATQQPEPEITETLQLTAALEAPGARCTVNSECSTGSCALFFIDRDGDGHGDPDITQAIHACSGGRVAGFSSLKDDCCDVGGSGAAQAKLIFPGQTAFFSTAQTVCSRVQSFDYNCNGAVEFEFESDTLATHGLCDKLRSGQCDGRKIWNTSGNPICGTVNPIETCGPSSGGLCLETDNGTQTQRTGCN